MKTKMTLPLLAMFMLFQTSFAEDRAYIQIMNGDTTINVGDSLVMDVVVFNRDSIAAVNPELKFYVRPYVLGRFVGNTFFAGKAGSGDIIAYVKGYNDRINIVVKDTVDNKSYTKKDSCENNHNPGYNNCNDSIENDCQRLRILPLDTVVGIGSVVNYKAEVLTDSDVWVNIDAEWSVQGSQICTINQDGRLEVSGNGVVYVIATTAEGRIITRVFSQEAMTDSTVLNTVSISKVLPNGWVHKTKVIKEGDRYVLSGLPAPLNILNGAQIYFPVGSLHEDIALKIKLPSFAKVDSGNNVDFGNKVLNAASFEVYVNDLHVEPYYFDIPLNVTIPFKRGLINKFGLDIAKLNLFYVNDSLQLDPNGISNVIVDSLSNKIYSFVAHFSTLVLTEQTQYLSKQTGPVSRKVTIYPNPFSDFVTINISDGQFEGLRVRITNLLGQALFSTEANSSMFQIDLSDFRAGMYTIQILDSGHNILSNTKLLKK
jgi:hypothetical protein